MAADSITVVVGIMGTITSMLVFLAPVPTFIRIYRAKSTLGFQCIPYVVALFSSTLWLYYAMLNRNPIVISINAIGVVIETLYISMYMFYGTLDTRIQTAKLVGFVNVGLYSFIVLVTCFTFGAVDRILYVGWISTVISVLVFVAPLCNVLEVVRTHSVEFMPFWLSFFLTLCATVWFFYGLLVKDPLISIPNVLGFIFGLLQMALYAYFRDNNSQVDLEGGGVTCNIFDDLVFYCINKWIVAY